MDKDALIKKFETTYGGGGDIRAYRSPGRVNLIGEHTDYNGGLCFPCALSLGITAAARKRGDNKINLVSEGFGKAEVDLNAVLYQKSHGWANYPKGVISQILSSGAVLSGFDVYLTGDLPSAAGLSSSASIELLTCVMLNDLFELNISAIEMIKLCQRAENNFVGVNCGIMDQFAVGAGREGHGMVLDCRTLALTYVPLSFKEHSIIIGDTKYKRGLADSKYNERRAECEAAVEALKRRIGIECLSDVTVEALNQNEKYITDPTVRKRARHVVAENARVSAAAERLNEGDLISFGRLMNESHASLKNDYEVTGPHLDHMAEAAQKAPGCLGSRMTGAGFGGSTVSIVENGAVDDFIKRVANKYHSATGISPVFYKAEASAGAGRLI